MRPRHAAVRPRDDRGTFSAFTAIFTLAIVLFAGLVIDGGLVIHARQRALDIAEQAARAGADNIDVARVRSGGEPVIRVAGACARSRKIVDQYADSDSSTCTAGTDEVVVSVKKTVKTAFLRLVDIDAVTVTVEAAAHPEDGA